MQLMCVVPYNIRVLFINFTRIIKHLKLHKLYYVCVCVCVCVGG